MLENTPEHKCEMIMRLLSQSLPVHTHTHTSYLTGLKLNRLRWSARLIERGNLFHYVQSDGDEASLAAEKVNYRVKMLLHFGERRLHGKGGRIRSKDTRIILVSFQSCNTLVRSQKFRISESNANTLYNTKRILLIFNQVKGKLRNIGLETGKKPPKVTNILTITYSKTDKNLKKKQPV